jgi:hypothetical protein
LVRLVDREEEAIEIILDYRQRTGVPERVSKAFV